LPFTERVDGSPVALNVYGAEPPVAARVAVYGEPTVPFGRLVVMMLNGAFAIVSVTVLVAVFGGVAESLTISVTLAPVTAVVGVPVI